LEDLNLSGSSLPPLHPPASPSSGSSRRKSAACVARPPVDPRGKTVRISNRSIDILPESMLPKNRRSSTSSRPRHYIGAPPLFGDSHSLSSISSRSSSIASMEDPRMQYSLSSFDYSQSSRIDSAATGNPPPYLGATGSSPSYGARHRLGSMQTISSHSSVQSVSTHSSISSISQASTKSSRSKSSSNSSVIELEPLSKIDSLPSAKTASSEVTYTMEPFKLQTPGSPELGKELRRKPSWQGSVSEEGSPRPFGRIDSLSSAKTASSEVTYTMEPFKLQIPGSPELEKEVRRKPSWQGSVSEEGSPRPSGRIDSLSSAKTASSEGTYTMEPFKLKSPGSSDPEKKVMRKPSWQASTSEEQAAFYAESSSSSDDSFIRHARSLDIDLKKSPHRTDRAHRVVTPIPAFPTESISFDSPNPIWKKLEDEKRRQMKLRARLHASHGEMEEAPSPPRSRVKTASTRIGIGWVAIECS
jgi:hypothetical protein